MFALFVFSAAAMGAKPLPFWKAKPKVYERIQNREIIVSVTSVSTGSKAPRHHLQVEGGGQVRTPRSFLFEHAQHYSKLAKTGYIKDVVYNAKTQILRMKFEAFGHSETMRLKMVPHKGKDEDRLAFTILSGGLKGMKGELIFTSVAPTSSEVGIHADYFYNEFPIPKLFLEFGLEVIFQKMAGHLRQFVEDRYEQTKTSGT